MFALFKQGFHPGERNQEAHCRARLAGTLILPAVLSFPLWPLPITPQQHWILRGKGQTEVPPSIQDAVIPLSVP
jgi:hypothetical protein